jgi:hypothetical protein
VQQILKLTQLSLAFNSFERYLLVLFRLEVEETLRLSRLDDGQNIYTLPVDFRQVIHDSWN